MATAMMTVEELVEKITQYLRAVGWSKIYKNLPKNVGNGSIFMCLETLCTKILIHHYDIFSD